MDDKLSRNLKSRHIQLIALGGTIMLGFAFVFRGILAPKEPEPVAGAAPAPA